MQLREGIAIRVLTTRLGAIWLAGVLMLLLTGAALADKRVALVIGNSEYATLGKLANSVNDATDIGSVLAGMGFEVTAKTDVTARQLALLLSDFTKQADGADIALFYYSGHGLQVGSESYFVPVDATLDNRMALQMETVSLKTVTEVMAGAKTSLIFVDACRSFPIEGTFLNAPGNRITPVKGLLLPDRVAGAVIGFAASPGETAADGYDRNSPFTSAMLEFLPKPGIDINTMFNGVSARVQDATRDKQRPQMVSGLTINIILVPGAPAVTTGAPSEEERAYNYAVSVGTIGAYRAFLGRYPGGFFAELAKEALAKLEAPHVPAEPAAPAPSSEPEEPAGPTPAETMAASTCDRLAGDPEDPRRASQGASFEDLDAPASEAACVVAVAGFPDEPRYAYQLARALTALNKIDGALTALRDAAAAGYPRALYWYGLDYRDGLYVAADRDKAEDLLQKASEAGLIEAMRALGTMYQDGPSSDEYLKAAKWFQKAADLGDADSMTRLGLLYDNGRGVTMDVKMARLWYERAYSLHYADAGFLLAWTWANNDRGPGDPERAAELFMATLGTGNEEYVRTLASGNLLRPTAIALQKQLRDHGFYNGPIDGRFGPATQSALRTAAGLEVPAAAPDASPPTASPTPAPAAASIGGSWNTSTHGAYVCNFGDGVITINASGTGYANVGGYTGNIATIRRSGSSVGFSYKYVDDLGDEAIVTYTGTLSRDGNSISGDLTGTWGSGCTFDMTRQ